MTEETKNLLELSADTLKTERRRGRKLLVLLAVLLVLLAAGGMMLYFSSFKTETRTSTVFLKECVGGNDYIYLQESGHLLRLECGEDVEFDSITTDDQCYEMEYRWNVRTYQGKLTACRLTNRVSLGGLMDVESEIFKGRLFGHEEVYYRDESYYPDPYGTPLGKAYLCTYRFWLWHHEPEWQENLLVIKDCIAATVVDLDGDGEKEVAARTRWPEKPYTVYDWQGGEFVQTWPETLPQEILDKLVAIWEQ